MAEEIETLITPVILLDGIGDFSKLLNPVAGIVKRGDEFKIAAVGVFEQLGEDVEAVDVLLHRGNLALSAPVMSLDFTVVPELGDIVGSCFNAQDDPELVVHLD